jgi:hypothetical protein
VINLPEWPPLTSEYCEISSIVTDDRERAARPLTSNDAPPHGSIEHVTPNQWVSAIMKFPRLEGLAIT